MDWTNLSNFNYWVAFRINLIDVAKISCSCSFNNLWMLPQLSKKKKKKKSYPIP